MRGSSLRGATLYSASFIGARLKGVNFTNAHYEETDFRGVVNLPDTVKKRLSENWRAN